MEVYLHQSGSYCRVRSIVFCRTSHQRERSSSFIREGMSGGTTESEGEVGDLIGYRRRSEGI
jgi:hypothetical protein